MCETCEGIYGLCFVLFLPLCVLKSQMKLLEYCGCFAFIHVQYTAVTSLQQAL